MVVRLPECVVRVVVCLVALSFASSNAFSQESAFEGNDHQLILAHYMPWFEAKPLSLDWGWHWTMNHFNPENKTDGRREIASHYYPVIGPYDSSDVHVLEYHLLTMKLAGIDGVIVDWYGLSDLNDYALLHRNAQKLLDHIARCGMRFVVCYEDQTIPALVMAGKITRDERVAHALKEIEWLGDHWFSSKSYATLDGKPVLLSFGQTGLTDEEWSWCLEKARTKVTYFSQHHRRTAAAGAFDWPVPTDATNAFERFIKESQDWPASIPVAFPRFVDIYAEAKVSDSYGNVDDDKGNWFRNSLERALATKSRIVQLATWNDWGEGTCIEPSREFGVRDLEVVQSLRRQYIDPKFAPKPDALLLPRKLLELRRSATDASKQRVCDHIAELLKSGEWMKARSALDAPGR